MRKTSPIGSAVAATLSLAAANSWALTPAQVVRAIGAGGNGLILRVAGSTATDPAFKAYSSVINADPSAICQDTTLDVYTSAHSYTMTCSSSANITTITTGTPLIIQKQTAGGSARGISPVAQGTTVSGYEDLSFINTTNCTAASSTVAAVAGATNSYNVWSCGGSATESSQTPNTGISDEDPTTWIGSGSPAVSSTDAAHLNAVHEVQVPFAFIVSKALYARLQTAEGLSNNDNVANIPSLSRTTLRSIITGQISDWKNVLVLDRATHAVQTAVGFAPTATTGSPMHYCRRGSTSGTELAQAIWTVGNGCAKGNGVPSVSPSDQSDDSAGSTFGFAFTANSDPLEDVEDFFFSGSGTGDVIACVSSTWTNNNSANGPVDTAGYRIGVVSTDQKSTETIGAGVAGSNSSTDPWIHSNQWRYIAIDDAPPTLYSAMLGRYDFVTEDSFNSSNTATNALTTAQSNLWTFITGHFSNTRAISALNAATSKNAADISQSDGDNTGDADTGLLVLPGSVIPPLGAGWPGNIRNFAAGQGPVSTVTKSPAGTLNNCLNAAQAEPIG